MSILDARSLSPVFCGLELALPATATGPAAGEWRLASLASGHSRVVDRALSLRGTSPAIRLSLAAGAAPPGWRASSRHLQPLGVRRSALPCSASFHGRSIGVVSARNGLRQRQADAAGLLDPTATCPAYQPRGSGANLGATVAMELTRNGRERRAAEQGDEADEAGLRMELRSLSLCSADWSWPCRQTATRLAEGNDVWRGWPAVTRE